MGVATSTNQRHPSRRFRYPLIAAASLTIACGADPLPDAERVVLERELANLSSYQELDVGSALGEGDIVIVLHERTLAGLLTEALPVEETIAGRFRVRLRSAEVDFRTGLALVQFSGRVSLVERPSVFVDATVFGLLEIARLDQELGVLLAQVEILAVEAQDIIVGGWSAPAARLASELATRKGNEFNELFGDLPVPILLERNIRLPAVSDSSVTIPSVDVPLTARVGNVLTADERLWVVVDIEVDYSSPKTAAEPAAAVSRATAPGAP